MFGALVDQLSHFPLIHHDIGPVIVEKVTQRSSSIIFLLFCFLSEEIQAQPSPSGTLLDISMTPQ